MTSDTFTEWSDAEFIQRMMAAATELEWFDRQMMYKTTKLIATSPAEVDQVTHQLCDEVEHLVERVQELLRQASTNAALFCALTVLMRGALTSCCDTAESINRRRVN